MINTKLKDGYGGGYTARIDSEGAVQVVLHQHPPTVESVQTLPFSQFFTDDGTATGSNNMIVDGSVAPVPFFVKSSDEFDIYIKSITIQISDPGARLDRFGALTALTNGIRWYYLDPETGEYNLATGISTNLDFFRDATGGKGFGDTTPFLADIQGGAGEDTYLPEIDLRDRYGMHWGLRLEKGKRSKLVFEVNDNLAGLSVFNIKAYGIRF